MEPALWLADPAPSPEAQAERSDLVESIQNNLQALPDHYRLVVMLVDVEGLSYEETAIALDLPVGTVKSRLARASNSLRMSLQHHPDLIPAAYILDFPVTTSIC